LGLTVRMKSALVVSRRPTLEIEEILMKEGFKVVGESPDFIVCYGGDGTVLFAERTFPQVPKLIVKRSSICRKCDYTLNDVADVLHRIREQEFRICKEIKLEARFKEKRLIGLNEIQVHTKLPIYAVRLSLVVDGREFDNLIGDGVIVATPFGSTGYYKSTGGKHFEKGIGVSFNNLHNKKIESFVVSEDSTVTIKVNRGPALMLADNNQNFLELKDDDRFTVKRSESVANFIYVPQ